MSHVQNNWRPTARIAHLKKRAEIIKTIRKFFDDRGLFEVETPIMASHTITDPFIQAITANHQQQQYYLQTSPEYFMKRLLAADSGDIYQISKCFREDETGQLHNPEFTLLEWYRVDFDHQQLMDEVDDLLQAILPCQKAQRLSYQHIFLQTIDLDPLTATIKELKSAAKHIDCPDMGNDKDAWLQILFSEMIEPTLQQTTFIYDYPASQAALAQLSPNDNRVAERFEVYSNGIELANGFHELTDYQQQLIRFEHDNNIRQQHQRPTQQIDPQFIAALTHGLPKCAGVALGIDRLIMLALKQHDIASGLSFRL